MGSEEHMTAIISTTVADLYRHGTRPLLSKPTFSSTSLIKKKGFTINSVLIGLKVKTS